MSSFPSAARLFTASLSLACVGLLSACGGGGGSSSSNIRLLNATSSYSTLALTVNDISVNSGVAYAALGAYTNVSTSATVSQVQTSGVGTTVASLTPTLAKDSNYTLIAYGWAGAVHTSLLQEAQAAPATAKASLLVLNLAPDAGALDVYLTAAGDSADNAAAVATNVAGGYSSSYNTVNSGTYRVQVTGYNNKTDLRLDIPAITLASAGVATLVITATDGGVLVNGILVAQQGAATNYASNVSRARVVASVADNSLVAATLNGTSLLGSSVAPTIGNYQNFAAGSSTLAVMVNAVPLTVTTPTLKAGADYTLLVWGSSSAPQVTVLADDNRLPATTGTAKMRMVNGVAGTQTGLTLSLDYSALATNVLPGTASVMAGVPSSTSSLLSVTSPSSSTPIYSIAALPVVANGVYTTFILGGSNNTTGTLRRER